MDCSLCDTLAELPADEIAAWTAVIALIVTIGISVWQTWVQNRYIRAQVSADLTAKLNDTNAVEMAYPEIPTLYDKPFDPKTALGHRLEVLTDMRMALLEEAFVQHRKYRLLDARDWAAWEAVLSRWTKRKFFPTYWEASRMTFREEFRKKVDSLLG